MAVTDSVSWEQREGQRMRTAHAAGDPRGGGGGAAGAGSRAALPHGACPLGCPASAFALSAQLLAG